MLVLTRKHQEKIRIGDHIVITVLKTKGKSVRLGIEAPVEVPVVRGELSFEGQAVEWQPESNEGEADPPRQNGIENKHVDRVRDHWPTKSPANGAPVRGPQKSAPQVSLQRIPREQVTQVLPNIVGDSGPLRAMLNRRSVSA